MPPRKSAAPKQETETCPRCGGTGFYIEEETNTTQRCDCGRVDTLEYQSRLRASGIPQRFLDKGFHNFQAGKRDRERAEIMTRGHEYASLFGDEWHHGLLLRGIPGSGKTHIAIAIMKEVMKRGFTAHYTNFTDLLTRIRSTFQNGAFLSEEDLLEPIDSTDLLVLDDVGAENLTDWVRDRLYLIVNRRYESAKPVIITTNCDEAELEARIGPRTASRLYEMCDFQFPPFPRVDWRKAQMR